MKIYGLIGKSLKHSFSQSYFLKKFKQENLRASYINFELNDIVEFNHFLPLIPELTGLNVTIPYKEAIIPYMHELSSEAKAIGAVNVIEFRNQKLIGHNTDWIGFNESLKDSFNLSKINKAIILGSGGASKAINYGLRQLNIDTSVVSSSGKTAHSYNDLEELLEDSELIVNCTPLGTYPNIEEKPAIPYSALNSRHHLFDLVYNPEMTAFLKEGQKQTCSVKNGYDMLVNQAEAAWSIWNASFNQ